MLVSALELATTLFLTFVDSCTLSNMKKQTISLIFEMTVIRSYFVVQLEEHLTKNSRLKLLIPNGGAFCTAA